MQTKSFRDIGMAREVWMKHGTPSFLPSIPVNFFYIIIRGSFLHGRKRMYMFSSLKFSLLNQFSVVEWKLNSALYGWPEPYTRGKDFKVFLDSIVRESLHCFSFAFLSHTNDNFVTKSTAGHGLPRDCRMSQVITVGCMQFQTTTFGHKLWWRRVI